MAPMTGAPIDNSQRPKPILVLAAAIFLAIAWIWDAFMRVGRWLAGLIPWAAFKTWVVGWIDRLPIVIVVLIYGIPFLIVEPLKGVLVWVIATGHVFAGVVSLILLETFGVGLLAVIFDLTRKRLLTLRWFAWCYDKVLIFHEFADRLVRPYKEAAKRQWAAFRQWARAYRARLFAAAKSGF
jgi:hypothetical protein